MATLHSRKSQTYTVTCTAYKSRWAEEVPGFKAMIKDFRVDVKPKRD